MKYLVTGASGFIGWHLVNRLAGEGHEVCAWTRTAATAWPGRNVTVRNVDVVDADGVNGSLREFTPAVIFHLAGQSSPARSWSEPANTLRINIDGTLNLLEAVRRMSGAHPRILTAGSSSQYAASTAGEPIVEDAPIRASSPYAASKIASDQLAALYAKAFGLPVVRFCPFFWIGSRKTGDVASDVARRIVAIERGAPPFLKVGRTDVVRDIIDVEDGISALLLLAERGEAGVAYNICSGRGTRIAQLIERFKAKAMTPFEIATDPDLMRSLDDPIKVGDPARLVALGWRPRKTLEQSVSNILKYWRSREDLRLSGGE